MSNHADTKSRIPTFSSIEEEAAFWDTHDTTEFEDEFEPVELEISDPLLHSIALRFDGPTFKRLVTVAKQHGVEPVALAQRWVEQALMRAEAGHPKPSKSELEADAGGPGRTSGDQALSADGYDRYGISPLSSSRSRPTASASRATKSRSWSSRNLLTFYPAP